MLWTHAQKNSCTTCLLTEAFLFSSLCRNEKICAHIKSLKITDVAEDEDEESEEPFSISTQEIQCFPRHAQLKAITLSAYEEESEEESEEIDYYGGGVTTTRHPVDFQMFLQHLLDTEATRARLSSVESLTLEVVCACLVISFSRSFACLLSFSSSPGMCCFFCVF